MTPSLRAQGLVREAQLIRRKSALALCAVLFAVAASGCSGSSSSPSPSPSPTPISDPNEIITRSLSGLQNVRTLHVEAKLDGSIDVGALNGLPGGLARQLIGKMKLDGSTLTGDVDIANRAAHFSASVPNLLGLTLDYIAVDGYLYAKVNLSGEKYNKTPMSSVLPGVDLAPSASLNIAESVGTFKAELDQAGVTAALVGRAKMEVKASSTKLGNLDLTVTLTKYDQPVTITAPPDSEVQAG